MTIKSQVRWLKVEIKELQVQIKKLLKKDDVSNLENLTVINLLRHKIKLKEFKIKNIEKGFPELGYWDNGPSKAISNNVKIELQNDAGIE